MYDFAYDGGINFINDGGGDDMYDNGNYLNTDITTEINYSDDVILASTDFGPNGQYFTRELPGLFMLAADIDGITEFSITGGLGADGDGIASGFTFNTSVLGQTYDVFYKSVSGDGDPSINHFIIIPSNTSASHTYSTDTDEDEHILSGISASTRLYYFLTSSFPDIPLSNQQVMDVTNVFLKSINGGNSIEATASTTEVCLDQTVTLTGAGGTTYTWDNSVVDGVAFVPPVGSTTYTVTGVGMNGCNNANSVTISTLENPDITLSTTDVLLGNDGSIYVTLNNGVFPFTYDWDNDGTGDFDDDQNLINVDAGTYTVVVSQGNGCTTSETATVNSQVGINSLVDEKLEIYPNPASEDFTIKFEGIFTYSIVNITGQILVNGVGENSETVSLENLSAGNYMISVSNENSAHTLQLVKK